MKKKNVTALIVVASCVVFSLSSIAYAKSQLTIDNRFSTGVVDISLDEYEEGVDGNLIEYSGSRELLPGAKISKIPRIENNGSSCYVRAKLDFSIDELEDSFYGMPEEWVKCNDGYWYYTNDIEPKVHVNIFEGIQVPEDFDSTNMGKDAELNIAVDAVQADNFIPDYSSNSPWGTVEIKKLVKGENYEISNLKVENPRRFEIQYDSETKSLVSNEDNFFKNIGTVMPGDRYSDVIELKNTSTDTVDLYFKTFAEDSDLLSKIKLSITMGSKEIYSGTLDSKELREEIKLVSLNAGQTEQLKFTMNVPKELDNSYVLSSKGVRWMFSTGETPDKSYNSGKGPKTGVTDMSMLYLAGMLSSLLVMMYTVYKKENR